LFGAEPPGGCDAGAALALREVNALVVDGARRRSQLDDPAQVHDEAAEFRLDQPTVPTLVDRIDCPGPSKSPSRTSSVP